MNAINPDARIMAIGCPEEAWSHQVGQLTDPEVAKITSIYQGVQEGVLFFVIWATPLDKSTGEVPWQVIFPKSTVNVIHLLPGLTWTE